MKNTPKIVKQIVSFAKSTQIFVCSYFQATLITTIVIEDLRRIRRQEKSNNLLSPCYVPVLTPHLMCPFRLLLSSPDNLSIFMQLYMSLDIK